MYHAKHAACHFWGKGATATLVSTRVQYTTQQQPLTTKSSLLCRYSIISYQVQYKLSVKKNHSSSSVGTMRIRNRIATRPRATAINPAPIK